MTRLLRKERLYLATSKARTPGYDRVPPHPVPPSETLLSFRRKLVDGRNFVYLCSPTTAFLCAASLAVPPIRKTLTLRYRLKCLCGLFCTCQVACGRNEQDVLLAQTHVELNKTVF